MKSYLCFLLVLLLSASPALADITYTLDEDYGNVPVTFVPNVGQFDSTIAFAAEGNDGNSHGGNSGVVFQLEDDETIAPLYPDDAMFDRKLYLQFLNANTNPTVTYQDPAAWNSNYFIGNVPGNWRTDVPNYYTVRLDEIYTGIDMLVRGNGRDIEYMLVLEPGADPSQILFSDYQEDITGVSGGSLVGGKLWAGDVETIVESPPTAYQHIGGEKIPVSVGFSFFDQGIEPAADHIGFGIGSYDPEYDLYISLDIFDSPLMVVRSGGVAEIEVDDEGCVYVAGGVQYGKGETNVTLSIPFTMKFNPDGDALEYVTYFGRASITGMTLSKNNLLYVTGGGSPIDFPSPTDSYNSYQEGEGCSYITKIYEGEIVATAFIGKGGIQCAAVDNEENVYVSGRTNEEGYITTPEAYDTSINGNFDIFVTKLDSQLKKLVYSTFIGGSGSDYVSNITVNSNDELLLSGKAGYNYPLTVESYSMEENRNTFEALFTKLNSDGSDILVSAFIGGGDYDEAIEVEYDNSGNVILIGTTRSLDYPITDNALYKDFQGGYEDLFISKFSPDGTLLYSTYFGGSSTDRAKSAAILNNNNIIVTGRTNSSDFPIFTGALLEDDAQGDAFITAFDSYSNNFSFSTYMYGSGGISIDVNKMNNIYICCLGAMPFTAGIFEDELFITRLVNDSGTVVESFDADNSLLLLTPPYPNPFNPIVILSYYLPQSEHVILKIYNIQGQLIETLVNTYQATGNHQITWDASGYSTGLYFYCIHTNKKILSGKVLFLK